MLCYIEAKDGDLRRLLTAKLASVICGCLLLVSLMVSGAGIVSAEVAGEVGKFTVVRGSVDALREQQDAPIAARVGMPTMLDDVIRTKRRSRTQLRFLDNTVLNMGSNYSVKVKNYVFDKGKKIRRAVLSSLRGVVRATVAKMGADADSLFEIETPTAVVSVRGTDFIVKVNSAMQTEVVVLEGAVAVRNIDPKISGSVLVHAGEKTTVSKNSPPTPVVIVPAQIQNMLIAETTAGAGKQTATRSESQKQPAAKQKKPGSRFTSQAAPQSGTAPLLPNTAPLAPPPPFQPVATGGTTPASPVVSPATGKPAAASTPPVQPPATSTNPALLTVPVQLNVLF